MEFKQIAEERYATKSFDGKKIPENKVKELLEMIKLAPTSLNVQPWKMMVISNKELRAKLAPAAWNQAQITTSSHLIVFLANTDITGNINLLEKEMLASGAKPADIKGYLDMLRGFDKGLPAEQRLPWAQRQLYIALGNAINGAKSLGFDSCPMEGFSPEEFSKILGLPNNLVPTALVAIGYASDKPRPKFRFSDKDMIIRKD